MDKFLTPFSMLTGSENTKVYLVIGALIALAIAANCKQQPTQ